MHTTPQRLTLRRGEGYQRVVKAGIDSRCLSSGYVELESGASVGVHSTGDHEELVVVLAGQGEMTGPSGTLAIGEGVVDFKTYFQQFAILCSEAPVHVETISGFQRDLPFFRDDFWRPFPRARARDFAKFLALAKRGRPLEKWTPPPGKDRKEAEKAYQKAELERSLAYCREELGLGLK